MVFQIRQNSVDTTLRFQSAELFDSPLMESNHFVCVPSLGSMMPGWVLISPKRPLMNIAQVCGSERQELVQFFEDVRDKVEHLYGATCAFEHGAQVAGSATGCGVDQAHLHLVPISIDQLYREVSTQMDWQPSPFAMPFDLDVQLQEYLWLSGRHRTFVARPAVPVSQFFRRAVAKILRADDQWDYRVNPFHDHIAETMRALDPASEDSQSRAA